MSRLNLLVGTLSAGLLLALPAASFAAGTSGSGAKSSAKPVTRVIYGTIQSLSGSTATILSPTGVTTSVSLGARTRFTAEDLHAALTGLRVGEQAAVRGIVSNTGTLTASILLYGTSTFGLPAVASGTLAGSTQQLLTVNEPNGQVLSLPVNSQTTYFLNGKRTSVPSSLPVGDTVKVRYAILTNGSLVARQVHVVAPGLSTARIVGTVAAVSGTSLTLTTTSGTVTVQLKPSTRFVVDGARLAARPTFTTGQQVSITALKTMQGRYIARIVFSLS